MSRHARLLSLALTVALAGCGRSGFPEDQRIEGPFRITTQWQTIEFTEPLVVNRQGVQGLHFVVDGKRYRPNSHFDIDDQANHFNLRREDGVLVKPEVMLVSTGDRDIPIHPVANTYLYGGGLTIGFGTYIDHYTVPPDFPGGIEAFKAVRVRSNVPFVAQRIEWDMDVHPDLHRCGGRQCRWWDDLLHWAMGR